METIPTYRSLLPHEPLPFQLESDDGNGYVHIQGAFIPKFVYSSSAAAKQDISDDNTESDGVIDGLTDPGVIKNMMLRALKCDESYLPSDSSLFLLPCDCRHVAVKSIELILEGNNNGKGNSKQSSNAAEEGPANSQAVITKARITYESPIVARSVVAFLRHWKISPSMLFYPSEEIQNMAKNSENCGFVYSTKHIQATQVTTTPLPPSHLAWPRVGMPKFRRLLLNAHATGADVEKIHRERGQTRFVFMTNIIDVATADTADILIRNGSGDECEELDLEEIIQCLKKEPFLFQDAIREAIAPYCAAATPSIESSSSSLEDLHIHMPAEVFVPSKKQLSPFKYCHIGTRSPLHAQALIRELQGKNLILNMSIPISNQDETIDANTKVHPIQIKTGKLFLDFADITQRSAAKSSRLRPSEATSSSEDMVAGEPSRPECTSTTSNVTVPGLMCISDFVSEEEEQVLLACLTGPNAPWAPSQSNFSKTGSVKRRVQHYGYVFDYETADVLRERNVGDDRKGACPKMPLLPKGHEEWNADDLNEFARKMVKDGNGWDVLAAVVERVRRYNFDNSVCVDEAKCDAVQNGSHNDTENSTVANEQTGNSLESNFCPFIQFPNLNQITVNEYKRGQGIGSHIDTESAFGDGLLSISLGGHCVMEFRNEKILTQGTQDLKMKKLVHLPPRSLLLMSGPARYEWSHQIVTRMTDCVDGNVIPRKTRVSLTLRTAITLPDEEGKVQPLERAESNAYPPRWGNKNGAEDLDDDDIATPETERNHVHAVYDAIAQQWHHTRGKRGVLWPGATQFLKALPKGSLVADVGCGDGKYFPAIWEAGSYVIGTDISKPLLHTSIGACENTTSTPDKGMGPQNRQVSANKSGLNARPAVAVADCMHIPLRTKSCDAAICIAVMHHLSTAPRRRRCLEELSRVVKIGGRINVQAWALEQHKGSRRKFAGTDVFVPFNAQPRYLDKVEAEKKDAKKTETHRIPIEANTECKGVAEMYSDAYEGAEYDERKGLVVFQRYCHMYKEGELEDLVFKIDSLEMVESGFESGNHFVILKVVK